MNYQIRYVHQALLDVRGLPGFYRQRAKGVIEALASDPRPPKSKELRDLPTCRRIWLGQSWRIIYQVEDDSETVYVLGVRPKNSRTYQDLQLAFQPGKD